jgi:hypothetical protein
MNVCLKDVLRFKVFSCFFGTLELWLHAEKHLNHSQGLERFRYGFYLFTAVRAVLLLFKPVRQTTSAENVEARSQLYGLVKQLVANTTFVLLSQLFNELLVFVWLSWDRFWWSIFHGLRFSAVNLRVGSVKVVH